MLDINWADVEGVLQNVRPHLIGFGAVVIAAILVMIFCQKQPPGKKFLIRCQAGLAVFLALIITVNLICFGPMSSMIDLATGGGTISEETSDGALAMAANVAREGIVLLQNDQDTAACPQKARILPPPLQEKMGQMLGALKSVRRENEYFL